MIPKFFRVSDNIYRGGEPSFEDLNLLKNTYYIQRIISLDQNIGTKIDPWTKQLNIEHITIPIDSGGTHMTDSLNYLYRNIVNLLQSKQPVFIHCKRGQDRTGLAIALYRVKHDGWSCEQALNEARRFEYGNGLSLATQNLYKKILCGMTADSHAIADGHILETGPLIMDSQTPLFAVPAPIPAYRSRFLQDVVIDNNIPMTTTPVESNIQRIAGTFRKLPVEVGAKNTAKKLKIETLEGTMTANPGDWIVTGPKGEKYPVKPDIFEETYEPTDKKSEKEWQKVYSQMIQNDLKKLSYAIEMSFNITEEEKNIATEIVELFRIMLNSLDKATSYLDIIYDPFKQATNLDSKLIHQKRGILNRFKQKTFENFSDVKTKAFSAIKKLHYFSSDSQIMELINSFQDNIQDIEKQLKIFSDIFENYKSPEFKDNLIKSIDEIKKQCAQAEHFVIDRIIDHVNTNILTKNWTTEVGDDLGTKINPDKIPAITRLFEERQEVLNPSIIMNKRQQILNPALEQRFYNPSDLRRGNLEEK